MKNPDRPSVETSENPFDRAKGNIDRLAREQWSQKSREEQETLSEIVGTRLSELAEAPSLKLVVRGDRRSLEPSGSETLGEGLDISEASILFGLAHTMENLALTDSYREELEDVFGKPVEVIDLDKKES
jgi:hypothetical protein